MIYENALIEVVKPRFSSTIGRMIYLVVDTGVALWYDEYPEEYDERGRVERSAIPIWRIRNSRGKEYTVKERFLRIRTLPNKE